MIVKVCGTREAQNITDLSSLEIDMIGFIFYEKSSRYIGKTPPMDVATLPQNRVGVFVNEPIPSLLEKVGLFSLDYIQLHGDESAGFCQNIKSVWPSIKIIKAFSIDDTFDFEKTQAYELYCDYFIFDTKGIKRGAIRNLGVPQLAGVDINSCFEDEPGLKNTDKVSEFVKAIKA